MGQLFFKREMQTAIREGRKQTTLRRWHKPRVKAGQLAFSPGLGWLSIDSVENVEIDGLTEHDARADGFESRASLLDGLQALYPDAAIDGKSWFIVRFRLDRLLPPRRARAMPDAN